MCKTTRGPSAVLAELVQQGAADRAAAADRNDDAHERAVLARKLEAIAHEHAGDWAILGSMTKLPVLAATLAETVQAAGESQPSKGTPTAEPRSAEPRSAEPRSAEPPKPADEATDKDGALAVLKKLLEALDNPDGAVRHAPKLAAQHAQDFGQDARRAEDAARQAQSADKQARLGIHKLAELAEAIGRARGGQS